MTQPITRHEVFEWCMWSSVAVIFSGPAVVAYQLLMWLRTGAWPTISIADFLVWVGSPLPSTTWVGAERVLTWLLDLPASFMLFAGGIGLMLAVLRWIDPLTEHERKLRMQRLTPPPN